jgi:hypothetical protein
MHSSNVTIHTCIHTLELFRGGGGPKTIVRERRDLSRSSDRQNHTCAMDIDFEYQ